MARLDEAVNEDMRRVVIARLLEQLRPLTLTIDDVVKTPERKKVDVDEETVPAKPSKNEPYVMNNYAVPKTISVRQFLKGAKKGTGVRRRGIRLRRTRSIYGRRYESKLYSARAQQLSRPAESYAPPSFYRPTISGNAWRAYG